MPNPEFNHDMERYMKQRSTRSDYSYLEAQPTPLPEPTMTEPVETNDEMMDEPEQKRGGFFSKVKSFFSSDDEQLPAPEQDYEPYSPDPHEDCLTDIRQLGKITLEVLRALPERELVGFKNSDQYAQLKHILGKHKLIKSDD